MLVGQQLGGPKLEELEIGEADLSVLSSELLLGAIRRLEVIVFRGTTFTEEQLNAILRMVSEGRQGNLQYIRIIRPDVQGTVSQELLQAAGQVEYLLEIEFDEDENSDVDENADEDENADIE